MGRITEDKNLFGSTDNETIALFNSQDFITKRNSYIATASHTRASLRLSKVFVMLACLRYIIYSSIHANLLSCQFELLSFFDKIIPLIPVPFQSLHLLYY